MNEEKRYIYGTRKAADYMGINRRTLNLWMERGKFPRPLKQVDPSQPHFGQNMFDVEILDKHAQ